MFHEWWCGLKSKVITGLKSGLIHSDCLHILSDDVFNFRFKKGYRDWWSYNSICLKYNVTGTFFNNSIALRAESFTISNVQ